MSWYLNGFGLLALEAPRDRLAGVLAGLERDRAELRQDLLGLRVRDRGDVADGVDLRMIRDGELRPDADPVAALELEPERLDELVPLQAGAPDERVRLELRARTSASTRVGETDATASPVITSTVRFSSAFSRVRAEVRLEHREDVRPGLDEDDAGLLLRDVG